VKGKSNCPCTRPGGPMRFYYNKWRLRSQKFWRKRKMYKNEIIEVVNGRVNKKLKQWYDAKVKDLALLLVKKLQSQNIQIQRFELEKDEQRFELEKNIQNPPLEIAEEVLSK